MEFHWFIPYIRSPAANIHIFGLVYSTMIDVLTVRPSEICITVTLLLSNGRRMQHSVILGRDHHPEIVQQL